MTDFKASYIDLLAALCSNIESLLAEYHDRILLSQTQCEALWQGFEALRERFGDLKLEADAILVDAPPGYAALGRSFLTELERLLDVENDGDDWESYVDAAMIHAEERICDEARAVAGWR
jgi:hypothetical protein